MIDGMPGVCRQCGRSISEKRQRRHAVFCSTKCRVAGMEDLTYYKNMDKGSVGAMHEMIVCCDLLKHGYNVFRNVAPTGKCDLIIHRFGGSILRVEVTGYRLNRGGIVYPKKEHKGFDILAICVASSAEIVYKCSDEYDA